MPAMRGAASIARMQSTAPPYGTLATTFSVAGLITSQVPPEAAQFQAPSMCC